MTDTTPENKMATRCRICGGQREEHGPGLTQHAFTLNDGELVTLEEKRKQATPGMGQPQVVRLSGGTHTEGGAINKLIEVLMEKGLLDVPEALYIVGIGTKPTKPSGFADPARQM